MLYPEGSILPATDFSYLVNSHSHYFLWHIESFLKSCWFCFLPIHIHFFCHCACVNPAISYLDHCSSLLFTLLQSCSLPQPHSQSYSLHWASTMDLSYLWSYQTVYDLTTASTHTPNCIRTSCLCPWLCMFPGHSQFASLTITSPDLDKVVFPRSLLKCITLGHTFFLTLLISFHIILKFGSISSLNSQLFEIGLYLKYLAQFQEHRRY